MNISKNSSIFQAKLYQFYSQIDLFKEKNSSGPSNRENEFDNTDKNDNNQINSIKKDENDEIDENEMNIDTQSKKSNSNQKNSNEYSNNSSFITKGWDTTLAKYVEWYEANKLLLMIEERDDLNKLLDQIEERELKLLDEIYSFENI